MIPPLWRIWFLWSWLDGINHPSHHVASAAPVVVAPAGVSFIVPLALGGGPGGVVPLLFPESLLPPGLFLLPAALQLLLAAALPVPAALRLFLLAAAALGLLLAAQASGLLLLLAADPRFLLPALPLLFLDAAALRLLGGVGGLFPGGLFPADLGLLAADGLALLPGLLADLMLLAEIPAGDADDDEDQGHQQGQPDIEVPQDYIDPGDKGKEGGVGHVADGGHVHGAEVLSVVDDGH